MWALRNPSVRTDTTWFHYRNRNTSTTASLYSALAVLPLQCTRCQCLPWAVLSILAPRTTCARIRIISILLTKFPEMDDGKVLKYLHFICDIWFINLYYVRTVRHSGNLSVATAHSYAHTIRWLFFFRAARFLGVFFTKFPDRFS